MRTFYTGSDIEDLAAGGIRQLEIGPGVALTDAARERAEELGILLLVPGTTGSSSGSLAGALQAGGKAAALESSPPSRPRGCQHGPLTVSGAGQSAGGGKTTGGPVVDQLVEAMNALKKQGA